MTAAAPYYPLPTPTEQVNTLREQAALDPAIALAHLRQYLPQGQDPHALPEPLLHAAIDVGLGESAYADTLAFIRERARPWADAEVEAARLEPFIIAEVGRLQVQLRAAQVLLAQAASAPAEQRPVAALQAQVQAQRTAVLLSEKLFELSGSRATLAEFGLARHWQQAQRPRPLPALRQNVLALGQYALSVRPGVPLPPAGERAADAASALQLARYLATEFASGAAERDRERRLPHAELDRLSASGLLALTVPKAFGGLDASVATVAEVIALLSAADGSIGQIPQNHFYALEVLRVNGTAAQQRRLFAEAQAGVRFGNALAEIGTKTSQHRTTSLTPDGTGNRINGRKFYATGALFAQRVPTSVIDPEGRQQMAFVHREASGLRIIDDWSGMGQRTTGSGSVVFEQVYVDADDVVPFQASFERPTAVGPVAQLLHAAIDTGLARGAFDRARQLAEPHDDLVAYSLGELAVHVAATEALLRVAGEHVQAAREAPDSARVAAASLAVAEVRALSTDTSLAAGNLLVELAGSGAGLDRYWRNARTHTLHDPVRWKYHAIGNYHLNGELPPRKGYL
ncbi:SfnB family sulfur acquisition oxidoreductase [Pseudomonas sp. CA3A]|uniref:SfnB family sulfur acquisition oxidoreductase n=1 Tax=Pseudomonas typographi TaxID=2715964 RepID=A0ABR7Z0X9_9PSED|nr:SfnB family sulfur acquisition oxidoreductase [Pseudomonas typographi]